MHNLATGLVIALVPSAIISFLLIQFADLEKYKESPFGNYIRKYMTRQMESIGFAGYVVMVVGAWLHSVWLIIFGLVIILFGWLKGRIFPLQS